MSSGLEHREAAEALGAYALGALSDAEAARVQHHLSQCRECRAELDWLRAGVDVLPASVPQIDPPPELKRRLMEIIHSEAELLRAAGPPADQPEPPARSRGWRWLPAASWRSGLAVAAGCLAVVAIVLVLTAGGAGTRTIQARITPALLGRVQAALNVNGSSAELVIRGMPAPPANHIDQVWVKHGSAPPESAGTFIVHTGSVQVELPVKPGDLVMVTIEPGRGSAAPSSKPVMVVKV